MKSIRKIVVGIIFIILFQGILTAQAQKEDITADSTYEAPAYCIRAAIGLGRSSISFGDIAYCRLDLKNIFFSFRYGDAIELFPDHAPGHEAKDYSFLFGISYTKEIFYASIGTGIGKVIIIDPGRLISLPHNVEKVTDSTIGWPVQMDLFLTPVNGIGIGLVYYCNINSIHSFSGYVICIQFGKLR